VTLRRRRYCQNVKCRRWDIDTAEELCPECGLPTRDWVGMRSRDAVDAVYRDARLEQRRHEPDDGSEPPVRKPHQKS
jgi:hypothetical protein